MTKSEIRKIESRSREARMWAGEQIAKGADCASEDDVEGFQRCMAEAARLTLVSAKLTKEVRAAIVEMERAA